MTRLTQEECLHALGCLGVCAVLALNVVLWGFIFGVPL